MRRAIRHLASFLLVLSLGTAAARSQCPAGRWVTLAPLNDPRQELAAAALDGKIYAVAGLAGSATANEIYDPAGDHWSFGAEYPIPTDHAWAVAFEGVLYVGGGRSNRVFSYDPAADAWTELASSSFFHGGTPAAAVLGERIVVAGGTGGGMTGNEVEAYDPATDVWTELPPMQTGRHGIYAAVLSNRIYLPGGATIQGLGVTGVNETYVIETPRQPVTLPGSPSGTPQVVGRE